LPKPKRKADELTTHEAVHKLFGKRGVKHLKKRAGTDEPKPEKLPKSKFKTAQKTDHRGCQKAGPALAALVSATPAVSRIPKDCSRGPIDWRKTILTPHVICNRHISLEHAV
jgi:hypothetical protein